MSIVCIKTGNFFTQTGQKISNCSCHFTPYILPEVAYRYFKTDTYHTEDMKIFPFADLGIQRCRHTTHVQSVHVSDCSKCPYKTRRERQERRYQSSGVSVVVSSSCLRINALRTHDPAASVSQRLQAAACSSHENPVTVYTHAVTQPMTLYPNIGSFDDVVHAL